MKEYRVIVAGGRDFNDYSLMKNKLDYYLNEISKIYDIVIVSGTANGADKLGEKYASEHGYKVNRFPADWSLGKKAGPMRNKEMSENADACVVFWDNQSRGTKNMIDNAVKRKLPLRIVPY